MKKTVLVVDDTPDNLTVLVEILKPYYAVKAAPKGIIALKIAQSKPDLILLDINMPEMDGFEVLERLKSSETTNQIPVIFISSNSHPDEVQKGISLGASAYLFKPINASKVLTTIESFLENEVGGVYGN